jgi:hypothetical protein
MMGKNCSGFPTAMLPAAKAAARRTSSEAAEKCSIVFANVFLWTPKSLHGVQYD